jgi:hypothetical protein
VKEKILNFLINSAARAICCFIVCGLIFLFAFAVLEIEMPMYVPIAMAIVSAGLLILRNYFKTFK